MQRIKAPENGISIASQSNGDVLQALDRRMNDIITAWREIMVGIDPSTNAAGTDADTTVNTLVKRVEAAVRALQLGEVNLSPKRWLKRKRDSDDEHSPDTQRAFEQHDMELHLR